MLVAVVSWTAVAAGARSTARHAHELGARVGVLDLDGSYRAVGDELVLRGSDLGMPDVELRRLAVRTGAAALARSLQPALVRALAAAEGSNDAVVLVLAAGVLLLAEPQVVLGAAGTFGLALVARDPGPCVHDGRHPDAADLVANGLHHPGMIAVRSAALDDEAMARWADVEADESHWLDVLAIASPP